MTNATKNKKANIINKIKPVITVKADKISERKDKENLLNSQIVGDGYYIPINGNGYQQNHNTVIFDDFCSKNSQNYVKSNVLNMNGSYVIADPSGRLFDTLSEGLKEYGYKIKVFNLLEMGLSMKYNPFYYIRSTNDIPALVDVIVVNIEGMKKNDNDNLWDLSMKALLCSILGYLFETYPLEQRTFTNVLALLKMIDLDKAAMDSNYKSDLDLLMDDLDKQTNGESYAVQQYKVFKMSSISQNIILSAAIVMGRYFDLPELTELMCRDEMELDKIGEEKTALFVITSYCNKCNKLYSFLTSIFYWQLLRVLYQTGERRMYEEGTFTPALKVRTTLFLNGFNDINDIIEIPDIDQFFASCRKYDISIVCAVQPRAEYDPDCDYLLNSIIGNCKTIICSSGTRIIEELKEADIVNTKKLIKMKNEEMLVFVWGMKPQIIKRFPLQYHPNYHLFTKTNLLVGQPPVLTESFEKDDDEDTFLQEFFWNPNLWNSKSKGGE